MHSVTSRPANTSARSASKSETKAKRSKSIDVELPPLRRKLITLFALSAAFMTQLDTTIANVAMPHMQASTAASREQITWVLTSYIIMAAIITPLSGWLAVRFGRKRIIVISVLGFTIASVLCGMSANLGQLIGFRMLQGAMGAALLPMSQAILLDINPPERHAPAMALWGVGAVLGPILGPLAGGWLTEYWSWRWVFFINAPIGVMAYLGLQLTLADDRKSTPMRFDFLGFALLAMGVGMFQLMLDRGQLLDWFESREIWIEATLSGLGLSMFVVHALTHEHPFVRLRLFADRNYVVGNMLGFFLGGMLNGVLVLLTPMLAELMNYPIMLVGIVTAPRGFGIMAAMLVGGRIAKWVDPRLMILLGLALIAWSTVILAGSSLEMDSWPVIFGGIVQGIGGGFMFVPITTVVFATISPTLRTEGAAFNSLIRNLGAAVSISALQTATIRNAAVAHAGLVGELRPDNPMLDWRLPDFDFGVPHAVALLEGEVTRQALMAAYVQSFNIVFIASLIMAPCAILLRVRRSAS